MSQCSTDQSAVDLELPFLVAGVGNSLINMTGTIAITTYVTPKILFIVIPLGYLFRKLQVWRLLISSILMPVWHSRVQSAS
jgi:hypothetical protein